MNINNLVASPALTQQVEKTSEQKDKELKETCAAFEGMFFQMMMKTMRQSSMESSLVKKSNGEKIFTEMLDQEYVTLSAKSGASGMGESLYNYLKQTIPAENNQNGGNNFPAALNNNSYELKSAIAKSKNTGPSIDLIK